VLNNASVSICFGDSLGLSDGSFVNATGIYNDTLVAGASNGCDSIHIIDLTVNALIIDSALTTLCAGDSFVLSNGMLVNSAGLFADTLVAANGCDSIFVFDVSILPVSNSLNPQSICNGDFYVLPNGDTAVITGIYIYTLVGASINGCDSIIQTDLLVLPNPDTLIVDSFCSGLTYALASGVIINTPGVYNDTLFAGASNGCDSLLIYNLTFLTLPVPIIQLDTICFNETYTLANGTMVNTIGFYQDTLSGLSGCDSVVAVDLFVRPANNVLQQSGSLLLCEGDVALFYAESELSNVTYQWFANSIPIVAENNDTLIIPNALIGNSGTIYQLEIYSICDTVFSNAVLMNVRSLANILDNPVDTTVCEGDVASFSVNVDIPIQQLQWFENGVAIPGANASTYNTNATVPSDDGSQFFVALTDSCGNIDSSTVVTLSIIPNAVITNQSTDLTICAGDIANFFITATGPNLTYQWLENGIAIAGETNDSLTVSPTTAAMNGIVYSCQVNSTCNNLFSSNMTLTVNDTTVVADQSIDIEQCGGFSFDVFIDASNIATYQWQINQGGGFVNLTDGALGATTTQILGSNTSVLTISNYDLTITDAQFQVITTVNCGTAPIFIPVSVTITAPETGIVTLEDTILCLADVNPIFVSYVDGAALWSTGDFGQFVVPESTGDYIVNYTDANGCPRSDTIFIELEDCIAKCVITAPTGFSPNSSGANDVFRAIYTCDLSFFELQMYDRYGELIFMTNEPLQGWDGVFHGKNAELGVYTWYISYQKEGANIKEEITGNVTLIR
ncbi:MAG: gliding motility-associated-like protein, partial [Chitinophagales bacterium]